MYWPLVVSKRESISNSRSRRRFLDQGFGMRRSLGRDCGREHLVHVEGKVIKGIGKVLGTGLGFGLVDVDRESRGRFLVLIDWFAHSSTVQIVKELFLTVEDFVSLLADLILVDDLLEEVLIVD